MSALSCLGPAGIAVLTLSAFFADATIPVRKQVVCLQVVTYAANPATGECQAFPTPCDVPDAWAACQPHAS